MWYRLGFVLTGWKPIPRPSERRLKLRRIGRDRPMSYVLLTADTQLLQTKFRGTELTRDRNFRFSDRPPPNRTCGFPVGSVPDEIGRNDSGPHTDSRNLAPQSRCWTSGGCDIGVSCFGDAASITSAGNDVESSHRSL